ncbi:MAG: sulfatase-like hydrolase/transferase [Myxococcota bacterium]
MSRPHNILLLMTDQEMHHRWLPDLTLSGKGELLAKGRGFRRYHVHTTPCSPSRSTLYFGQHTQATGMVANVGMPPFPQLRPSLRSIGHVLRDRGYVTAYKGKWHLGGIGDTTDLIYGPYPNTSQDLEPFGFSDYNFDGDPHGTTWTGFRSDRQTAGDAIAWLGRAPSDKPWMLAVNFVNPHDVMFYWSADGQKASRTQADFLGPLSREPGIAPYDQAWREPLPTSLADTLEDKPWAVRSYARLVEQVYGHVPRDDEAAWHRLRSYYFNCIRDVDLQATAVLRALERLGLDDKTVVIYTSDHGEMAGAHGMRQKGPMIFRENVNVPLIVRHPDVVGGTETDALAGPLDLARTIVSIAGVPEDEEPQLKGVDLSPVIEDAAARTERDEIGTLLNYSVTMYIDPKLALRLIGTGRELTPRLFRKELAKHPLTGRDPLARRGFFRGIVHDRYKFARYFAPKDHHVPRDFDDLVARNDLELYDTHEDPDEMCNLAADPGAHRELVWSLASKTADLVAREVGADVGAGLLGPGFLYQRGP